ncbi:YoaK family protein [Paenibacillus sp. TAB 01]|uniref:YoaK family protein n=1 Tax=Paenibacillus sp. TAB 01 TaxID=3368988 RepID=UPI003753C6A0
MYMQTSRNAILLLLCFVSGIVDVIGYQGLGHVFTANMTGNIVLMGMAIGQAEGLAVLRTLVALAGFIAGTAIAAVMIGAGKEKLFWPKPVTAALSAEAFFLLLFAIGSMLHPANYSVYFLIIVLSTAMGMQTTAARRLGIAGISTTVLTNNLANVIEDAMHQLRALRKKERQFTFNQESLLRLLAILIYCLGAVAAAAAEPFFPVALLWLPVLLLAVVLAIVYRFPAAVKAEA